MFNLRPVSRDVGLRRLGATTANGIFISTSQFSIQLFHPVLPFKTLEWDCIFRIEWSSYKQFWNVFTSNNLVHFHWAEFFERLNNQISVY